MNERPASLPTTSDDARYCSKCGNLNHDVEDGVLDCGHSLDDGAALIDAEELLARAEEYADRIFDIATHALVMGGYRREDERV